MFGATIKITNRMQLYRLIYYSKSALHVSDDVYAHHREHLTVLNELKLSFNSFETPAGSNLGEYCQVLQIESSAPDDG
jgi:hypothetical protein